ncbi:blue copper protein-like [Cryptomeria japonica]|uniref:blue copper protein-like n=1 Tax=Cryptomeria japonica TaxID=3369 RepID=UPI0025ACF6D3|nr:blue copper protein-like [Cryptomeria japonica]
MALRIAAMAALLVLCVSYHSAEATDYTVGDAQQWGFGVNYTTWASSKTFLVGDTLVFTYANGAHDVLEVQKSAYDSCATSNPTKQYTDGNTRISLTSSGTRYFICGITGHCSGGMKVAVTVSAGTSTTPSAPSPSTKTAPGPTSAGHMSQLKDVLVLLLGSLIMSLILA